jgi:hypothetical protein
MILVKCVKAFLFIDSLKRTCAILYKSELYYPTHAYTDQTTLFPSSLGSFLGYWRSLLVQIPPIDPSISCIGFIPRFQKIRAFQMHIMALIGAYTFLSLT